VSLDSELIPKQWTLKILWQ